MCEFSWKLVAWMDGELPEEEMSAVGAHVPWCNECRWEVEAFRTVSVAFAECARTVAPRSGRRVRAMVALGTIAAAVLVALFMMPRRSPEVQARFVPPAATIAPSPAVPTQPTRTVARRMAKRISKRVNPQTVWMPAEPTIQIAIPADALFPPGALPDGINFVADLRLAANGSPASVALRP